MVDFPDCPCFPAKFPPHFFLIFFSPGIGILIERRAFEDSENTPSPPPRPFPKCFEFEFRTYGSVRLIIVLVIQWLPRFLQSGIVGITLSLTRCKREEQRPVMMVPAPFFFSPFFRLPYAPFLQVSMPSSDRTRIADLSFFSFHHPLSCSVLFYGSAVTAAAGPQNLECPSTLTDLCKSFPRTPSHGSIPPHSPKALRKNPACCPLSRYNYLFPHLKRGFQILSGAMPRDKIFKINTGQIGSFPFLPRCNVFLDLFWTKYDSFFQLLFST